MLHSFFILFSFCVAARRIRKWRNYVCAHEAVVSELLELRNGKFKIKCNYFDEIKSIKNCTILISFCVAARRIRKWRNYVCAHEAVASELFELRNGKFKIKFNYFDEIKSIKN